MDSEYPPLPSPAPAPAANGPPRGPSLAGGKATAAKNGYRGDGAALDTSKPIYKKVLSSDGDVVLEYVDRHSRAPAPARYWWQVSSANLMRNSPYFAALLDPNKFAEGRRFEESKSRLTQQSSSAVSSTSNDKVDSADVSPRLQDDLPLVTLRVSRLSGKHRIDVLEIFLKVLCLNSPGDNQKETQLDEEIRHQPVSLIASLIDIADLFNSPQILHDTLKRAGYVASVKGSKVSLTTFSPALLKLGEERIRQIIYIAMFLDEGATFQVLTHSLILLGSANWVNGVGRPDLDSPRWAYLPNGIEEELYYRRQCVLNTITDLQAHFLRLYGALEDDPAEVRTTPSLPHAGATSTTTTATTTKSRPIQCRWGFSNSRACDSFHLGEMTRFFALRTKTIFLGSTLIDPGFDEEEDLINSNNNHNNNNTEATATADHQQTSPPGDILSLTASLRQIPDYQIDSNHVGCGIRRRLLPLLDCIDRFTGSSGRGLLGLVLRVWKSPSSTSNSNTNDSNSNSDLNSNSNSKLWMNANSWSNWLLRRAESVDIRASRIVDIRYVSAPTTVHKSPSTMSSSFPGSLPPEEETRLFFTARRRNWES
ncbi:hypothetical protein VTN77DRAFT_8054 [Rasamsonia byssochlamydoides]|uniref:uncharacterized protein n=1 Tax=Rasamsonia byssochlamydoides TaxID=89139 RepID=UPI003743CB44